MKKMTAKPPILPRPYCGECNPGQVSVISQESRSGETKSHTPPQVILDAFKKRDNQKQAEARCQKLLEAIGWGCGTGCRIPFANDENKKLEKELEVKQRKVLSMKLVLEDDVQHVTALEQHVERVQEDVRSYRNLLKSKQSLYEEEQNFFGISSRILNGLEGEKISLEKIIEGCLERSSIMKSELDRRLKAVLELRDIIDFDSEALKDYHERIKEFEEVEMEVEKLSLEDEKRIKELEDARAELGASRKELRNKLDQEAMNTQKFHEQFDRLSVEFRKVHLQRQDMVGMWAATINSMRDKDDRMKIIADEYYELKQKLREAKGEAERKEKRLQMQLVGIQSAEMTLSELDRRMGDIRRKIEAGKEITESLKDAIFLGKVEINYANKRMQEKLSGIEQLGQALSGNEKEYERRIEIVKTLKEKLAKLETAGQTRDSRITQLEEILDAEEKTMELLIKERDQLRGYAWQNAYERSAITEKLKHLNTDNVKLKNLLMTLMGNTKSNTELLNKRTGNLYKQDLEISMMENRIIRLTNKTVDPEFVLLQNSTTMLKKELLKISCEHTFISEEMYRVNVQITKCDNDIYQYRMDYAELDTKLRQCVQLTHGLEKRIEMTTKELNNEQVSYCLERVNLRRLRSELESEREQIYGLAEIRNSINWAAKERKEEIDNYRALNTCKYRSLIESVSKLKSQVFEVHYRCDRLKGRFDLITKLMSRSQDAIPEQQTLAYQVRKAARERETIQVEAGKWRVRVEEAAKELEGLTNVHTMMNASNSSFKDCLSPAGEHSEENKAIQELSREEQEIVLRRNRARTYRMILSDRMDELGDKLVVIENEVTATKQQRESKNSQGVKADEELHRQAEKVRRWNGMCARVLREIKPLITQENFQLIQIDVKLRFTGTKFESAVSMMERVLQNYPQTKKILFTLLSKDSTNKTFLKMYNHFRKLFGSMSSFSSSSRSSSTSSSGFSGSVESGSSGEIEEYGSAWDGTGDNRSHSSSTPKSTIKRSSQSKQSTVGWGSGEKYQNK